MTKWLVLAVALTGCTASPDTAVTYEIDIGFPAGSSIAIDGAPVVSGQVILDHFASLDDLFAWTATADVVAPDATMFQVQMTTDGLAGHLDHCEAGSITDVEQRWELDRGQSVDGPYVFWTGSGSAKDADGGGCGWTY